MRLSVFRKWAALAGLFRKPNGTTAQYVRGDGSVADFPVVPARVWTMPTRPLNTAFKVSDTRDSFVSYVVDIAVTALLGGVSGRVHLEFADDQLFTTGVTEVNSSINATSGVLNVSNVGPGNVHGWVPAGKWVRIRTENVSGSPTFTFRGALEVLQ